MGYDSDTDGSSTATASDANMGDDSSWDGSADDGTSDSTSDDDWTTDDSVSSDDGAVDDGYDGTISDDGATDEVSDDGSSDDGGYLGSTSSSTVTPGSYTDGNGTVHMAADTITAHGPDADADQDYPNLEPTQHTVQSGDTMKDIADKYGVDLPTLIHSNPHIQNPDRIFPGQSLNIPERKDPRQQIRETFRQFQQ
jgi:spore coat assembly protein SafA